MHLKKLMSAFSAIMLPFALFAQITTSNITGVVKNAAGTNLSGATIAAVHQPTGSVYSTASRTGGQFDISNLNPGGPYTINVTYVGYETEMHTDVYLVLGETIRQEFTLREKSTQLTEVVITGARSSTAKNGTETTIGRDRLANLPT